MATQWKYKQGEKEFGPVTSQKLKELAAAGQLTADELVWKEGLSDWVSARRVKGLFDSNAENAAAALSGVNLGANVEKLNLAAKPENSTAAAQGRTSSDANDPPVQKKFRQSCKAKAHQQPDRNRVSRNEKLLPQDLRSHTTSIGITPSAANARAL